MRIIAGEYRGRVLQAPKGLATRPTTNRVREAVMSSIESLTGGVEGLSVLDAFAGSGLFGFELLSRGASYVEAYDTDHKAQMAIKNNVSLLKLSRIQYRLIARNVFEAAVQSACSFDVIVLDPPYSMPVRDVCSLLIKLVDADKINEGAIFVYEHAQSCSLEQDRNCLKMLKDKQIAFVREKRYGETRISYLVYKSTR